MEAALIGLLLSLVAPLVVGDACLRRAWPRLGFGVLRLSLAAGLGLGLCSCTFFLGGLVLGIAPGAVVAVDAVVLVVALLVARGAGAEAVPRVAAARLPAVLTGLVALVAVTVFVAVSVHQPHGDGDAMATWNLRARFLHEAWGQWDLVFGKVGLAHTDYPLLVPLLVTRAWSYGVGDVLAPAGVAFVFTLGAFGVLVGTLTRLRGTDGPMAALLAALALVGTPFFVQHGANQSADVPLAFFALVAVALGLLQEREEGAGPSWLCGLALGCAAWTKNEGALVALVLGGVAVAVALRQRATRRCAALALGAALPAVALLVFKTGFDVGNDLVEAQGDGGALARMFDAERWLMVAAWFGGQLWSLSMEGEHGGWGYVPLVAYAVCVGRAPGVRVPWIPALALATIIAGYFMVFVAVTPYDLDWHLRTTSGRLLLQVWPATLLVVMSVAWVPGVRSGEDPP